MSTYFVEDHLIAVNAALKARADHDGAAWTAEEDELVRECAWTEPLEVIAEVLGRTLFAVRRRRTILVGTPRGTNRSREYRGWTEDMGDGYDTV